MVTLFKFFLWFTSYFLISKCSDLQIKEVYQGFDYKDGGLIIESCNLDPDLLFSQLSSIKFLNELSLREFVFDEVSVKEFSKAISVLPVKKLSLIQCDFNEEMANLFSVPPSVKSIHLEQLNLSSNGIEIILSKLDPSVESITISACYVNEKKKHPQSFSKFSSLKQIDIDKRSIGGSNVYNSLRSFTTSSLESIKLRQFNLDASEINSVFKEWAGKYGKSFTDNLKVFELSTFRYNFIDSNELVRQLLSFANLESLFCKFNGDDIYFNLAALPPKLEKLDLEGAVINIKTNQESIFNQNILSAYHLTHLTVNNNFDEFPSHLFNMKSLEYLDLYGIYCHKMPISTEFQSPSSLKHLVIQAKHLSPFFSNFDKHFNAIERLEISIRNYKHIFNDLEKLFTNSTLKALKLEFRFDDLSNLYFKSNQKCVCLIEELELKWVSWEFICHLLDKFSFLQLKKINFLFKWKTYDLYEVLNKLQTLTKLTSISFEGNTDWKFDKKLPFMFNNLVSFNFELNWFNAIELDYLILGMPKLQSLYFPTWNNNALILQQPAINIRYLHLPINVNEFSKTNWINLLKNLPNLIQLRNCYKKSFVEDEITAGYLAYYLKILREYFKSDFQFEIQYDCLPILLLKKDSQLLKLVRNKSKELKIYLSTIFPLNTFGTFAQQLFMIEYEVFFSSINFPLLIKFLKLANELEIESRLDAMFVKGILLDEWHGRFTETTDLSLANFCSKLLNYIIRRDKISLNMEHLNFVIQLFKANKQQRFSTIVEFSKVFFISISTGGSNNRFVDSEMFCYFSSYLLAPSFRPFFDKILKNELSEKETKFLSMDYESVAENLKKLKPEQYEELSIQFKDFLIKFTNASFVESFSSLLRKILIPATKCAICFESLFSKECKFFFNSKEKECHLFHKSCLDKWLNANNKCPQCHQNIF